MKTILTIIISVFSLVGSAQIVQIMNYSELENRIDSKSDTVYLVNFWATWCRPCVEELPDFLQLNDELHDTNFKLILVSLDFSNQIEKRVIPFLKSKNINAEVIVLDDPDANKWISKVYETWDGAIPVSIVLHGDKKEFYGNSLNYHELSKIIKPKIKN